MSTKTIRAEILCSLESLTEGDLEKFVFCLMDQYPRVPAFKVEKKSRVEVTKVMISTLTATGALKAAVDTLRAIECNEEVDSLESRTKSLLDKGQKVSCSQEAPDVSCPQQPPQGFKPPAKKPEKVEVEAKETVKSQAGDPSNKRLALSQCTIKFGKHQGKTFESLLENYGDYVAYILALHRREREDGSKDQHPLMLNKDDLAEYATFFPDVMKLFTLEFDGQAVVGFGKFKKCTLKDLYNSKDEEKVGYVQYLRGMEHAATKCFQMDVAIGYILRRDQHKPTYSGPKEPTGRKRGGASRKVVHNSSPKRKRW